MNTRDELVGARQGRAEAGHRYTQPMGKLKLNQLEMLVAVAAAGSFSAASVELGCTQSRISHAIAELEQHVGTRVLNRSKSGCSLTQAGKEVLSHARQILSLATEITHTTKKGAEVVGSVRLACIRSAATHLVPHIVEVLGQKYPGIHMDILDGCSDYAAVPELIQQGRADIGITQELVNPQLTAYPFVSDLYVVIAPATITLKSPACWSELSQLPFIQFQQLGSLLIVEQCRAAGLTQPPARVLTSEGAIMALVGRGLGYTVLPRLTAFPVAPGTQVLPLPFHAVRKLTVLAARWSANLMHVRRVMQIILDKQLIMKTDAWHAGVIQFD